MKSKKNGFTLLEVILTIMIMSIVFLVVSNVFSLTIRANRVANDEFDLQSNMRIVSESLNQSIKFSPAVFTLKKETFQAEKKPGWRYFGIEDENATENTSGNTQVVEYIPIIESDIDGVITYKTEGETHTRKILLDEPDGTKFNLYFQKDITAENGKLLEFVIEGVQDNNIQRKMTVKTQLQAINAMVVEHAGDPAVAIAYKEEVPGKRIKGTQEAYAVITITLDTSGSMYDYDLAGNEDGEPSRIDVLKEKTEKLINDLKKAGDNIYVSVITYGNRVDGHDIELPTFKKISDPDIMPALENKGGTNTGEGLLKAYNMLIGKPITIPQGAKVNYYNILLTDGNPTSWTEYMLKGDKTAPYTNPSYPVQDLNNRYRTRDVNRWIIWPIWSEYSHTEHYFYRDRWENSYNYTYTGKGGDPNISSNRVNGMNYVKRIAKDYISNPDLGIKSYIIGFGSGNDELSKEIASYCVGLNSKVDNPLNKPNDKGEKTKAYYSATSATELDIVYSELTEMIKGDMWHVMGPY